MCLLEKLQLRFSQEAEEEASCVDTRSRKTYVLHMCRYTYVKVLSEYICTFRLDTVGDETKIASTPKLNFGNFAGRTPTWYQRVFTARGT